MGLPTLIAYHVIPDTCMIPLLKLALSFVTLAAKRVMVTQIKIV